MKNNFKGLVVTLKENEGFDIFLEDESVIRVAVIKVGDSKIKLIVDDPKRRRVSRFK